MRSTDVFIFGARSEGILRLNVKTIKFFCDDLIKMQIPSDPNSSSKPYSFGYKLTALGFLMLFIIGIGISTLYLFQGDRILNGLFRADEGLSFLECLLISSTIITFFGSMWILVSKIFWIGKKLMRIA